MILKIEYENFRRCLDDAPDGTYEQAKALGAVIGKTCDDLIKGVRNAGLKADNCDLIYEIEASIYGYTKKSNPDALVFIEAEAFGAAMNGPARERVLQQTVRDRDFLQSIGTIGQI